MVSPVPEASPTHPGWTLCSASPGGVRAGGGAATSKEAHSEGSGRAGRRKESPDCWAAAGCCGPPAQSVPPDLAPPVPPLQFASFSFRFPSSSSPPSSGNLPPETHHSLKRRQGQCQSPAETRGRTSNHAPYLPFTAKEVQDPRSPGRVLPLFIPSLVDGDHLPPTKPSLQPCVRLPVDFSHKTHLLVSAQAVQVFLLVPETDLESVSSSGW